MPLPWAEPTSSSIRSLVQLRPSDNSCTMEVGDLTPGRRTRPLVRATFEMPHGVNRVRVVCEETGTILLKMRINGQTNTDLCEIHESSHHDKILVTFRKGNNRISIGENCTIYGSFNIAAGGTLLIGSGVTCTGPLSIYVFEGTTVTIGDNCLFSNNVIFRPSDAHRIFDQETKVRINNPANITLGNHVWVGEHVSILKGSIIPDGCVIGTRSLVTKRFSEPNCIIAGNPAKIIRRGIYWN